MQREMHTAQDSTRGLWACLLQCNVHAGFDKGTVATPGLAPQTIYGDHDLAATGPT